MSDKPRNYLAPFDGCDHLIPQPVQNGGWVVRVDGLPGFISTTIGAFSNTADMLEALNSALNLRTNSERK